MLEPVAKHVSAVACAKVASCQPAAEQSASAAEQSASAAWLDDENRGRGLESKRDEIVSISPRPARQM